MVQESFLITGGVEKNEPAIILDGQIGHYFQVLEEDSISFQSQITDNYIENNTAVQDHIALNPVTITMRGYVGEVVFTPPMAFWNNLTGVLEGQITKNDTATTATTKLAPIASLLPPVDNITQIAKNTAQYVESSFNRYKKIYDQLTDKKINPITSRQEDSAKKLKSLWLNRTLVEVITPYGYYENMAIQSISLTQGNTMTQSELSVTLKQIKYATTKTTKPDTKVMAWYNAVQRTEEANHGKAQGAKVDNSHFYNWFGNNAPYKNR